MSSPVSMATSWPSVVVGVFAILPIIFGSILDKSATGPPKSTVDPRQYIEEGIGRNTTSPLIGIPRVLVDDDGGTKTAMTSPLLSIQPPFAARCRTVPCRVRVRFTMDDLLHHFIITIRSIFIDGATITNLYVCNASHVHLFADKCTCFLPSISLFKLLHFS